MTTQVTPPSPTVSADLLRTIVTVLEGIKASLDVTSAQIITTDLTLKGLRGEIRSLATQLNTLNKKLDFLIELISKTT